MEIKCVVSCYDRSGMPTFYPVEIKCTQEDYDSGNHYDMAKEAAWDADYEGIGIVYDEYDGPSWLFEQFWK